MRTEVIVGIVIVALLVIGGIFYFRSPSTPTTTSTAPETTTPSAEVSTVILQNYAFNPSTISVKAGTTVTWTNQDNTAHKIVSDTGQHELESNDMIKGEIYEHTFNTAGTYTYHCAIHPSMKGTVIVSA